MSYPLREDMKDNKFFQKNPHGQYTQATSLFHELGCNYYMDSGISSSYKYTNVNLSKHKCDKTSIPDLICIQKSQALSSFQPNMDIIKNGNEFVIIPIDNVKVEIDTNSPIGIAEDYKCWPPPWFVVTVSALQILLFMHYTFIESYFSHKELLRSIFLWKPAATLCVWRYVVYSLYHIGWVHLCFNLAVQLCIGVPLEMIHGAARVAVIYMCGVVFGSLSTIFADDEILLVGSSGGVYALLAAHVADVVLNHPQMELGRLKLLAVTLVALLDIALAWLDHTSSIRTEDGTSTVSYIAHVTGAVIGLFMGLAVLKTFAHSTTTDMMQRTCRILLIVIVIVGICLLLFHNDMIVN